MDLPSKGVVWSLEFPRPFPQFPHFFPDMSSRVYLMQWQCTLEKYNIFFHAKGSGMCRENNKVKVKLLRKYFKVPAFSLYITVKSTGTDLTPPSFPMCSGINNAAIKVATFNLQHTMEGVRGQVRPLLTGSSERKFSWNNLVMNVLKLLTKKADLDEKNFRK